MTRPTTPPAPMTAMSGVDAVGRPAIDRDRERAGRRIAGDDARGQRRRRLALLESQRVLERVRAAGDRLLLLELGLRVRRSRGAASRSRARRREARSSSSRSNDRRRPRPTSSPEGARRRRRRAPRITGRPLFDCTCAEMSSTWPRQMTARSESVWRRTMGTILGGWNNSESIGRALSRARFFAAVRSSRASCRRRARRSTADPRPSPRAGPSPRAAACRGS